MGKKADRKKSATFFRFRREICNFVFSCFFSQILAEVAFCRFARFFYWVAFFYCAGRFFYSPQEMLFSMRMSCTHAVFPLFSLQILSEVTFFTVLFAFLRSPRNVVLNENVLYCKSPSFSEYQIIANLNLAGGGR